MNKYHILLLLLSYLLLSCDDVTKEQDDENIILGVWDSYYTDSDSLILTRVFTINHYSFFSFADGKTQKELNKQKYTISGNRILLEKYTQTFILKEDTLWITNSKQDQVTKYIRNKEYSLALEGDEMD